MKIHFNIAEAIVKTLSDIFLEGRQADRAVKHVLVSNKKWGSRDRRFIAESVYECVRWWRRYAALAGVEPAGAEDIKKVVSIYFYTRNFVLPESEGYVLPPEDVIEQRHRQILGMPAVRESVPDWLYQKGKAELGEAWDDELSSLNGPALPVLRVNTLKTNPAKALEALLEAGADAVPVPGYPEALLLQKRKDILSLDVYKNGWVEIQDASSQRIAHCLAPQPGDFVIDACAGAGGKTLHMAAIMQNKGRILAMDVELRKLTELEQRARRAGASMVSVAEISELVLKKYHASCNKLLLDVPCSGIGVLRRKPGAKWKLTQEFFNEITLLQSQLLDKYSALLQPGGIMVYATCSIFPSENDDQIKKFLYRHHGKFILEAAEHMMPTGGFDGFFMARLKKVN